MISHRSILEYFFKSSVNIRSDPCHPCSIGGNKKNRRSLFGFFLFRSFRSRVKVVNLDTAFWLFLPLQRFLYFCELIFVHLIIDLGRQTVDLDESFRCRVVERVLFGVGREFHIIQ
jgi:hypothetical protein